MSKKKPKSKLDKLTTKHDFSHLLKTKTAAKVIAAEEEVSYDVSSPLDKQIRRDLKVGLTVIGIFVFIIVIMWFLLGRTGWLYNITNNLKWF